jgi:acyl-CoA thioester hydrolase
MEKRYFPVVVRARYAETDQMGIVHHGVYPVWFEAARSALSRAVGIPYAEWESQGTLLMVSDLTCRYRQAARYDEEITVGVRVSEVVSRRVVFEYRVTRGDGTLIAEGETRHLVVSKETGRPAVMAGYLRDALLREPRGESASA